MSAPPPFPGQPRPFMQGGAPLGQVPLSFGGPIPGGFPPQPQLQFWAPPQGTTPSQGPGWQPPMPGTFLGQGYGQGPPMPSGPLSRTRLLVSGLPDLLNVDGTPAVGDSHIHNLFFSVCGGCKSVTMVPLTGQAFVEFETPEAAGMATSLNGRHVQLAPENPGTWAQLRVEYAMEVAPPPSVHPGGRPRSPSPPRRPRFSEMEARRIRDVLKSSADEAELLTAYDLVGFWMQHGECTKRHADLFYGLLQSTHARVKSMQAAKAERDTLRADEDARWAESVTTQCDGMAKMYEQAGAQRVKDVLSKAQRKHLAEMAATTQAMREQHAVEDEGAAKAAKLDGERAVIMDRAMAFANKMKSIAAEGGAGAMGQGAGHGAKRVKTGQPPPPAGQPPPPAGQPPPPAGQPPPPTGQPPPPTQPPPPGSAGRVAELESEVTSLRQQLRAREAAAGSDVAAVAAAMAVYLSTQPSGAGCSAEEIGAYISKFGHTRAAAAGLAVAEALSAHSPKVFRMGGDGLWYYSAVETIKEMLKPT